MRTFLRKIRKQLIESGSTRKYLVYAVGEIALVVIGILIALQINLWNEERKELAQGFDILHEIKENLEYNNDRFESEILEERAVVASIDILLENINGQKAYHDSLDNHFLMAAYFPSTARKSSGYENLKSNGVEIIKSDHLRKAIIDLYDGTYQELDDITRISYDNTANSIWPLFTKLFYTKPTLPNQSIGEIKVTPFNYAEVVNSNQFKGLISWWRHSRIVSIEVRMNAIEQNNGVLEKISK